MAVNLSKNGYELMDAYNEVVDNRSETNWALFTYEGNSNDIRLAGKGDGGLDEMVEELSSGKVMYAFCKVQHPNSNLPKYVLINWTGEGVRDSRKGLCANHVSSMANFLKGAHVTVNARGEDDVDPESIMGKVAMASGTSFNFHKESTKYSDQPRGPVGSVYQKTNAVDEINKTNKDNFWARSQRDEEVRRKDESQRAEEERQRMERERKEQDEVEAAERDRRAKERASLIDQQKSYQKKQEAEAIDQEQQQREQQESERKTSRGIHSAASVQKANEAASLISQRSFNPRDVFKQKEQSAGLNNGAEISRPGRLQSPFLSQKSIEREAPVEPQATGSPAPLLPKTSASTPSPVIPASPVPTPSPVIPASPVPTPSPVVTASPVPTPSPVVTASPVPTPSPVIPASPVPTSSPVIPASPVPTPSPVVPASPVPTPSPVVTASPVPTPSTVIPASPVPTSSPVIRASPVPTSSPVVTASPATPASPVQTEEEEYWSDDFDDDIEDATQEGPVGEEDLYGDPKASAETGHEEALYEDVHDVTPTVVEQGDMGMDKGVCARAVYDYQAADDSEITFDPDDIISGIEMVDEGWWRGFGPDGHYGMFPANYVELV